VLAALELDPRQLRDALDEVGDLVPELRANLLGADLRVLDNVVQQRRRDRLLVEPELRADLGRSERVVDERLARSPLLARVRVRGEPERAREQIAVDIVVVGRVLRSEPYRNCSSTTFRHRFARIPGAGFIVPIQNRCRLCSDDTSESAALSRSRAC